MVEICPNCKHYKTDVLEEPCLSCEKNIVRIDRENLRTNFEPCEKKDEWKDEWKPVESDGLPPAGVPLLVTVDRCGTEGPRRVVIGPVYYQKAVFGGHWGFFERGNEDHQIGPDFFKVTAWREWPDPWV